MLIPLYDDVPARRVPLVTLAMIVMNGIIFLWSQSLPPLRQEALVYQWGFVPARIGQLITHRRMAILLEQQDPRAGPWGPALRQVIFLEPRPVEIIATLATCLFLHGSWMHLLFNMWFLWLFGNNVEDRLGHAAFLVFYLIGGLAATLTHWLVFPQSQIPVIGASGAIAAVLGAYAITWPYARVFTLVFLLIFFTVVPLPAYLVLGGWFLVQLVFGITSTHPGIGESVAWWAHIGGFVAGVLLMPMFRSLFDREQEIASPE